MIILHLHHNACSDFLSLTDLFDQ